MLIDTCVSCGSRNIKPITVDYDYLGTVVKEVPITACLDCGEEMVISTVLERVSQLVKQGINVYTDL